MFPKKLSGAENRKRKKEKDKQVEQLTCSITKFLRRSDSAGDSIPTTSSAFENEYELPEAEDIQQAVSSFASSGDLHQLDKDNTISTFDKSQEYNFDKGDGGEPHEMDSEKIDFNDPYSWPSNLTTSLKDQLISHGPVEIKDMNFPINELHRHFSIKHLMRKLDNGEKLKRKWLIYSQTADSVYCFCCKIFGNKMSVSISQLASSGFRDWRHLSIRLQEHERSPDHIRAYCQWVEADIRLKTETGIDASQQRLIKQEVLHWQGVLERLMAVTMFLAERNMAFRGHTEKLFAPHNGNFLGLIELLGKFDDVMREHIRRICSNEISDHYCSKTIQNELINLLADEVLKNIILRVKLARYFSIIVDCTPDVGHSEKTSFIIRFVHIEKGSVSVEEHFIGFQEARDSTGEGLTKLILETLSQNQLKLEDIRGQGYDNGANMVGKYKGVKTRILALNSRAAFVPCGCHSLNLVICDAASTTSDGITLFGILQRIYTLFAASVQRWQILKRHVPMITVKPLSETRWESRINSVKAVRFQAKKIHNALCEIVESTKDPGLKHEAHSLADKLLDFKFLVSLCIWYDILNQTNIVSKAMQNQDMNMVTVSKMIEDYLTFLSTYREKGFNDAIKDAKELAESLEAETEFIEQVRRRKKKKLFDYEGEDDEIGQTAEERFKRNFFYVTIDQALSSMQDRFKLFSEHKKLWGFLYNLEELPANLSSDCKDLHIALTEGDSVDLNGVELENELKNLKFILSEGQGTPVKVLNCINRNQLQETFPNVWIALRILLTIPVTVASAERSFSKLKLIKTYLRSTMEDERLSSLAMLSIENGIARELDLSQVTGYPQVCQRKS